MWIVGPREHNPEGNDRLLNEMAVFITNNEGDAWRVANRLNLVKSPDILSALTAEIYHDWEENIFCVKYVEYDDIQSQLGDRNILFNVVCVEGIANAENTIEEEMSKISEMFNGLPDCEYLLY